MKKAEVQAKIESLQNALKRPFVGIGSLIVKDGKVLVGERRGNHGSGTFMIPGGHLEFGESIEGTAIREAEEECGLKDFEVGGIISVSNDIAYDRHYVSIGVLLKWKSGEPIDAEPEKSGNWTWTDPKKLPTPMFPHSERVIKNWLAGKIYTR